MFIHRIRCSFCIAALSAISACGGSSDAGTPADMQAMPVAAAQNAPRADCEAEGCNRPRIIDGLAEQFRADALAREALAAQATTSTAVVAEGIASPAAGALPAPDQAPPAH